MSVVNCGQIEEINMPTDWQAGVQHEGTVGNSFYWEFHPEEVPEVRIEFFYRGTSLTDLEAGKFKELLNKSDSAGFSTTACTLRELFGDMLDNSVFELSEIQRAQLNGRPVLAVEGRYKEIDCRVLNIFLDADGSGKFVQEVVFRAPTDLYDSYVGTARKAIRSIRWK